MDDQSPKPLHARHPRSPSGALDEVAARTARLRLREEGIVAIEPDPPIQAVLEPGEHVVTIRRSVTIQDAADGPVRSGSLYVTDRRLVLVNGHPYACALGEIREAALAPGRLLLILADGHGLAIAVTDPAVLRVEIAAARAEDRALTAPPSG